MWKKWHGEHDNNNYNKNFREDATKDHNMTELGTTMHKHEVGEMVPTKKRNNTFNAQKQNGRRKKKTNTKNDDTEHTKQTITRQRHRHQTIHKYKKET